MIIGSMVRLSARAWLEQVILMHIRGVRIFEICIRGLYAYMQSVHAYIMRFQPTGISRERTEPAQTTPNTPTGGWRLAEVKRRHMVDKGLYSCKKAT